MAHLVTCRLCKQKFDADTKETTIIGKKSYYHTSCYNDWKVNKTNVNISGRDANFWHESLIDYLYHDIKMAIDFVKFESQWKNFIKENKGMTPKGIFFAIKYYYEVIKGNKLKAAGGIGIVISVYSESCEYWVQEENKRKGTIDDIVKQMQDRANRKVIPFSKIEKKQNKSKWNLEDIEND